jgi:hypothetical protein
LLIIEIIARVSIVLVILAGIGIILIIAGQISNHTVNDIVRRLIGFWILRREGFDGLSGKLPVGFRV